MQKRECQQSMDWTLNEVDPILRIIQINLAVNEDHKLNAVSNY